MTIRKTVISFADVKKFNDNNSVKNYEVKEKKPKKVRKDKIIFYK